MNFVISFWKTILCAIVVVFLSISSGDNLPEVHIPYIDKIVHFIMYFGLTLAVTHDFIHYRKMPIQHWKIILLSIIMVIGWGGFMEVLQRIPGLHRSSDFFDFLTNTIGAIVAAISYKLFEPLMDYINSLFIKK